MGENFFISERDLELRELFLNLRGEFKREIENLKDNLRENLREIFFIREKIEKLMSILQVLTKSIPILSKKKKKIH